MKIKEIYIRSFGKLKDYKLALTDGLNVLFGENEAGKTTIFNFILAMLYGIANSRGKELSDNIRKRYLTWGEDKIGGTMTIEHGGVTYVIDRRFGKT
ncbi:MAG: AAA family ATPase, partial [Clostridia bacterium]|nr:AAA family ATPase [Clostridia bacterium]